MSDTYDDRHNVPGHPIKPAATVHGTGSGEAECTCVSTLGDNPNCISHFGTPPASPTVTLDRETFDDLVMMLEKLAHSEQVINGMKIITHGLGARAIALDALALLRAAERHQS